MTVRTHAHRLTVEQLEAQTAEAAWQLAKALVIATKPVIAEAGESSMVAEEPRTYEATIDLDVATEVAAEERPVAVSEVMEEPTISGVDTTAVESHKERLPATFE